MEKAGGEHLFCLTTEMDCKELPAPPPPSPESRATHLSLPFNELLLLSAVVHRQRSDSTAETESNKNILLVQQSTNRNSPLRQVSSQKDVDADGRQIPSSCKSRHDSALKLSSFNNRCLTPSNPPGRERSSRVSSPPSVSRSRSQPTSAAFNMLCLPSTIHNITNPPQGDTLNGSRSASEASPRPFLNGRQISSPFICEQPSSFTFFSSPRPVTPSTPSDSRKDSFSTQSSGALRKDELVSYFSDSEDDEEEEEGRRSKRSSTLKKGSIEKAAPQRRSRRFRRKLSDTFSFLSCGIE